LWDGQIEEVIAACKAWLKFSLLPAQTATYFSNNCELIRSDPFRPAGYMIGSGTIESAYKQIVTQRLMMPGAPFAPCAEPFPWRLDNLLAHVGLWQIHNAPTV